MTNNQKIKAIANRLGIKIGSFQGSCEAGYYTAYSGVILSELPTIYQDNPGILDETPEWSVSTLMDWNYYNYQYSDWSGNIQNIDMNGYTFFHMISKEKRSRDEVNFDSVLEVAKSIWATHEKDVFEKEGASVESGSYVIEWDVLKFNRGEIYPDEEAYEVRILAMIPSVSVNAEGEDTGAVESQSADDFANEVESAKNTLLADNDAEIPEASPMYDGVLSVNDLKNAINSFDINNTDEVQVYEADWFTYLVVLKDKKAASDKWYNIAIINGVNEEEFNKALESQMFYTFEEVFVQDKLAWENAQSQDGKILNGANFKYAAVGTSQLWEPVVLINFDDTGKAIFCSITEKNIWKEMAIFIWWELITSPVIQAKICDGSAQIDGNFTAESAKELTNQLNDWALPAPLILMQEEKVSPTLWDNALNWALLAMAIWFIAIWLYMSFVYGWRKWLVSLLSLTIYTMVLFAIVKIIDYALSLSGIAAIILSIWMAVDANVLIFERMREEKENKKSDEEAINVAYDRSWNAIRDGQISTWMIGLLLMLMWINMFKWFGTMLVVWVLLTLLINAPVIKELLHIFYRKK